MKIRIAPPNSLVAISDAHGGEVPDPSAFTLELETQIISTSSCVLVACLAEVDGETEVVLGPAEDVAQSSSPALDQMLETPTRRVVVSTVQWKKLLEAEVPSSMTRLRVWTNSPKQPDQVIVGLGET